MSQSAQSIDQTSARTHGLSNGRLSGARRAEQDHVPLHCRT